MRQFSNCLFLIITIICGLYMTTSYDVEYKTKANVATIKENYQNAMRELQGTKE